MRHQAVHPEQCVVAGVLGVEHAFGELRLALVRRGGEPHENGGALDDVRAWNEQFFASRGGCPSTANDEGKGEYPLLSTSNL
jgi:hypothetical protein